MAKTTEFSHDTLGHLLKDNYLRIPRFQREYSWNEDNVKEFWDDIYNAFDKGEPYFLGTVVLADIDDADSRKSIVDGQQRMVTTALCMYALKDHLDSLGKADASKKIFSDFIADFNLESEANEPKLRLGPGDHPIYEKIINGEAEDLVNSKHSSRVLKAYELIREQVMEFDSSRTPYKRITEFHSYLTNDAQVLLAVASGMSEAYVIFETLNDRGLDLSTVDLLKNYFLSSVGESKIDEAIRIWDIITARLDASEKVVSFIKTDYTSRWGQVKKKDLYASLVDQIGRSSKESMEYLYKLEESLDLYIALTSPEAKLWSSVSIEVRDEILANRRFQMEVPNAMYLAAMRLWKPKEYCKLIQKGTRWSIRASLAKIVGGGTAEKLYGDLAREIARGNLTNTEDVRKRMLEKDFLPNDVQFVSALFGMPDSNLSRIKYLLAMLENAYRAEKGASVEAASAWESKNVSVDHIVAKSKKLEVDASGSNQDLANLQHTLANLTLLERTVNNQASDDSFDKKRLVYAKSAFLLTRKLGECDKFDDAAIRERKKLLEDLALKAWPV